MSNVVLLFSGQGAQKVGMGKDLYESYASARELFDQADTILGRPLSSLMFEGPDEELTKTANCQPALFVHGLALWTVLQEACPSLKPVATAGLSLGELTAHCAAGTFSFAEGLRLVAKRGAFMDEACSQTEGAMAAVIGGQVEQIAALAHRCEVEVANDNCPGQLVLSGSKEGIKQVVSEAKEAGARLAKPLKVAGAYHSRLMRSAQESLGQELEGLSLHSPRIPVVANLTARPVFTPEDIRHTLTHQVTGSVQWTQSMQYLLAEGHKTFLELGPGKVLAGFMGRIDPSATMHTAQDAASLEALLDSLAEQTKEP